MKAVTFKNSDLNNGILLRQKVRARLIEEALNLSNLAWAEGRGPTEAESRTRERLVALADELGELRNVPAEATG